MHNIKYSFDTSLGNLTHKASKALGKQLVKNFQQAGFEITTDQWLVLMALWMKDGQNQQDLAEFCEKDKTSITRIIDGLQNKEFVTRKTSTKDRRVNFIYLTEKALESKDLLYDQAEKTLLESCKGISEDDVRTCMEVLNSISNNLSEA